MVIKTTTEEKSEREKRAQVYEWLTVGNGWNLCEKKRIIIGRNKVQNKSKKVLDKTGAFWYTITCRRESDNGGPWKRYSEETERKNSQISERDNEVEVKLALDRSWVKDWT